MRKIIEKQLLKQSFLLQTLAQRNTRVKTNDKKKSIYIIAKI